MTAARRFAGMHYLIHLARLGARDIHPAGAGASRELIEALGLRPGHRLLELGCGTGNTILRLARRADVHVTGIDLLPEMLGSARRRLRTAAHCTLVHADACALPFLTASFDRVYAESVLGFQSDASVRRMLAEAFRVSKPGGLFVANEAIWKRHVEQATVVAVNRCTEADFGLRSASENAWSLEDWLAEIRSAGFETIASTELANAARERRPRLATRWSESARLIASPALLRDHLLYRRRLAIHAADRSLIESRLFIAARPR